MAPNKEARPSQMPKLSDSPRCRDRLKPAAPTLADTAKLSSASAKPRSRITSNIESSKRWPQKNAPLAPYTNKASAQIPLCWPLGRLKYSAQPFPIGGRGLPGGAVPGLVVHGAVRAQPEDVQPVVAPRGDCRGAGEHAPQSFPIGGRGLPGGAVPGLVVHGAVRAQPEDVQPVVAPRGHRRPAREHATQPFPVGGRGLPGGAVPGLVVHGAVRAQPEDVQAVVAPRGDP